MKKGFTLIEMIVSVILFGLITVVMFATVDNLRQQHRFYETQERKLIAKNRLISLLRSDFDRASAVTWSTDPDNRYSAAFITGAGRSLYGIYEPYVVWMVLKDEHRLVRLESAVPILLPIREETMYQVHTDSVKTLCERFRIYEGAKNRLIDLAFENEAPVLIEVSK